MSLSKEVPDDPTTNQYIIWNELDNAQSQIMCELDISGLEALVKMAEMTAIMIMVLADKQGAVAENKRLAKKLKE